ncbi:MAG: hypothetical protein QNK37_32830 [Acidobacteriota bacterium]|nr:hypothetical protein [Acidobacteriota bacterium]
MSKEMKMYGNDPNHINTGVTAAEQSSAYRGLLADLPDLHPSGVHRISKQQPKAYVVGKLSLSYPSQPRKESLLQARKIWQDTDQPTDGRTKTIQFLKGNPYWNEAVHWTIEIDDTPYYILEAPSLKGKIQLGKFLDFLARKESLLGISVAGIISGKQRLHTGEELPVIRIVDSRDWNLYTLAGVKEPDEAEEEPDADKEKLDKVKNFFDRIFPSIRNHGLKPEDRALNFGVTQAFNLGGLLSNDGANKFGLDNIQVNPSPISRKGSQCFDVRITLFEGEDRTKKQILRMTIDVNQIYPALVSDPISFNGT